MFSFDVLELSFTLNKLIWDKNNELCDILHAFGLDVKIVALLFRLGKIYCGLHFFPNG